MTTETPKLINIDGRLARIEGLLVKVSARLDRIEQSLSSLTAAQAVGAA